MSASVETIEYRATSAVASSKDAKGCWKINWVPAIVLCMFHAGGVAALFFFSWKAFALMMLTYWITIAFGIGMCYHRLLTHRSYQVPKFIEYTTAVVATLALEGGPISWVAVHRIHHRFSDKEGDPHTPRDGFGWAHLWWMMTGDPLHNQTELLSKYVPDLMEDRFHVWLSEYHWIPLTIFGIAVWATLGFHYVLWLVCMRVVLGHHATWLVNSATHKWGSRRFNTRDDSKNNWWVAILSFGEGWHNNHHAHPTSARHGLAWYEIDVTWMQIWVLRALGLAKNVQVPRLDPRAVADAKQEATVVT